MQTMLITIGCYLVEGLVILLLIESQNGKGKK